MTYIYLENWPSYDHSKWSNNVFIRPFDTLKDSSLQKHVVRCNRIRDNNFDCRNIDTGELSWRIY